MLCYKCGTEIKTHETTCPHCHEEFIPEAEPIFTIESGVYIINIYSDRITIIDVREQGSLYAHGGGLIGALIVGGIHALKNQKIAKNNGFLYSIPNEKFSRIAKRGSYISLYWTSYSAKKGRDVDLSFGVQFNKGHRHLNKSWEDFKNNFPRKEVLD